MHRDRKALEKTRAFPKRITVIAFQAIKNAGPA